MPGLPLADPYPGGVEAEGPLRGPAARADRAVSPGMLVIMTLPPLPLEVSPDRLQVEGLDGGHLFRGQRQGIDLLEAFEYLVDDLSGVWIPLKYEANARSYLSNWDSSLTRIDRAT